MGGFCCPSARRVRLFSVLMKTLLSSISSYVSGFFVGFGLVRVEGVLGVGWGLGVGGAGCWWGPLCVGVSGPVVLVPGLFLVWGVWVLRRCLSVGCGAGFGGSPALGGAVVLVVRGLLGGGGWWGAHRGWAFSVHLYSFSSTVHSFFYEALFFPIESRSLIPPVLCIYFFI